MFKRFVNDSVHFKYIKIKNDYFKYHLSTLLLYCIFDQIKYFKNISFFYLCMHFIFIYLLINIHKLCHVIEAYPGGPARSTPNQQKTSQKFI